MKCVNARIGRRSPGSQATVLFVLLYAAFQPAHAYVDPGTGAMVLQLAVAALAGVAFYFRAFRNWLWSVLRRDRGDAGAGERTDGGPSER
jgi:hypothetical protein